MISNRFKIINSFKDVAPDCILQFINAKSVTASDNTLRIYINNITTFLEWLKENGLYESPSDIDAISVELCNAFINERFNDSAVSTLLSTMSTLSSMFDYLVQNGYAKTNPFSYMERPRLKKSEPFRLTNDEKCALLNTINTGNNMSDRFIAQELSHGTRYRNQAIAKILIETGIKVSELVSLDIDDVCFVDNTLFIKNNSSHVMVSSDTMKTIKDCIDMRCLLSIPSDERALFLASQGKNKNKRISAQTVDSLIRRYAIAAGIKNADKINPNKLRQMKSLEDGGSL